MDELSDRLVAVTQEALQSVGLVGHYPMTQVAGAREAVVAVLRELAKIAPGTPEYAVEFDFDGLADQVSERCGREQLRGDDWCNCQAVRRTPNYPGPWHPDDAGCLRFDPVPIERRDDAGSA